MSRHSYTIQSQCRTGHAGRYRYYVDIKKKTAYLGCSWCGRSIGPRRNGRALYNLYVAGYSAGLNIVKANLPEHLEQAEVGFISQRKRS
jgi:hypothetical protein